MESSGAGRRPEVLAALAAAVALVTLTAWLGRLDLLDPDEGRHAEIAREMLATGRWLTPTLHGQPYYDKPAAFYWLIGSSMRLLGQSAFAARLPGALAALWTVFLTARFARRAYGCETGVLAALGLATTVGFVVIGRTVLVDACFTAALTSAFAYLGLWQIDERDTRDAPWMFYVAIGVACLLKGPAAAVLGAVVLVGTAVVHRDASVLRAARPIRGALLVLAVALPWYVAAWHADPQYIEEFLLRHNIERYLRPISVGHDEPWYYYLIALPVGLLPWTPVVLAGLRSRIGLRERTRADAFCIVWAGAVLALFLPAGTKLLTYLLPAFPPLVILGAAWLNEANASGASPHRWLAPYAAAWAVLVAVAALATPVFAALHAGSPGYRAWLALVPLCPLVAALRARHRRTTFPAAAIAGASLALTSVAFGFFADTVNDLRGTRSAAALVAQATRRPGAELVAYRCTPNAVAFYARRPAVLTRDAQRARAAVLQGPGALVTHKKRLRELDLDPPPAGVVLAWQNAGGLVLVLPRYDAKPGGEGRESNPPPTLKAGVTVLKTGRATGPDPSPSVARGQAVRARRIRARTSASSERGPSLCEVLEPR